MTIAAIDRELLADLWDRATELDDSGESPLAIAIISEALAGDPDHVAYDTQEVQENLDKIVEDIMALKRSLRMWATIRDEFDADE